MVEFFELVSSYWNKSKKDWHNHKHRLFTLFGFILMAYLVLEFGSYIFTSRLNHARTVDEIRNKFLDRRVDLADEFLKKFFILKEKTRLLLKGSENKKFNEQLCSKILKENNIYGLESDLFVSSSNLRYFFGDEIADEFVRFIKWYDLNDNTCFFEIPNAEKTIDQKIHSIRQKMWNKMYPPDIIKGIR